MSKLQQIKIIVLPCKCFLKAARDGYVPSVYNLGRCYFYGIGIEIDKKLAFDLFCKASEANYCEASFMAGYMCCYGDGINKDLNKAKEFYQKALELGMEEAKDELNKLK